MHRKDFFIGYDSLAEKTVNVGDLTPAERAGKYGLELVRQQVVLSGSPEEVARLGHALEVFSEITSAVGLVSGKRRDTHVYDVLRRQILVENIVTEGLPFVATELSPPTSES